MPRLFLNVSDAQMQGRLAWSQLFHLARSGLLDGRVEFIGGHVVVACTKKGDPGGHDFSQTKGVGHAFYADHKLSLRSEEHTSELQSLRHLVCRLLLEK